MSKTSIINRLLNKPGYLRVDKVGASTTYCVTELHWNNDESGEDRAEIEWCEEEAWENRVKIFKREDEEQLNAPNFVTPTTLRGADVVQQVHTHLLQPFHSELQRWHAVAKVKFFLRAPILKHVVLVDLPGFYNDRIDARAAITTDYLNQRLPVCTHHSKHYLTDI